MSQQVIQATSTGIVRLAPNGPIQKINHFLDSPWFLALIGLLTVLSNVFSAELIVYSVFIAFGIYIALFGTDFLPLIVILVCCYVAPSARNNPGWHSDSVFLPLNGGLYLAFLVILLLASILYRLTRDPALGGKSFTKCKRSLMPGMLLLGGAYMLGGAFSSRYFEVGIIAPAFALLQFLAVSGLYWFFSASVRWERVNRNYFAWLGFTVGLAVCFEVIGIYLLGNVLDGNLLTGSITTHEIYTGWGNKNNMGAVIAMMIPFGLCLTRREKWGWIFGLATLFMIAVLCMTCSRTSILFAAVTIVITSVLILMDPKWRKKYLLNVGVAAGVLFVILAILLHNHIFDLFEKFWSMDFRSVDKRFEDYQKGMQTFVKYPIFGETFYPSQNIYVWAEEELVQELLPARQHNTFIQLLTSCGIVGLTCYVIHRFQTVLLFWAKRRTEVIFVGLSILCMLMMSLFDCHFFNVGPTLFYSASLAFAEKHKGTL